MVWILDNVVELLGLFGDVATQDPVSFVLLATGALATGAAFAVMGYLAVGALLDALVPESIGRSPPPGA